MTATIQSACALKLMRRSLNKTKTHNNKKITNTNTSTHARNLSAHIVSDSFASVLFRSVATARCALGVMSYEVLFPYASSSGAVRAVAFV